MSEHNLPKHVMATKAYHPGTAGDLSRDEESLAIVHEYNAEKGVYIGNWISGFGFIGVEFDPEGMRSLTPDELAAAEQRHFVIGNTDYGKQRMAGYDEVERPTLSRARPQLPQADSGSAASHER